MADAGTRQSTTPADVAIDPAAPYGYTRAATLQAHFEQSAAASSPPTGGAAAKRTSSWPTSPSRAVASRASASSGRSRCWRRRATGSRVAGTSAGAIAAALIAAISTKGAPMTSLQGYLDNLAFTEFMQPRGKLHEFMDHHFGNAGEKLSDADGPRPPDGRLRRRLPRHVARPDHGRPRRAHLRRPQDHDGGRSGHEPPESRRYRLVVHTSDITRGQLARLPWDYDFYGQNRDEQDVVAAVRASMSIPFFFEPVTFDALPADVDVPSPGGGSIRAHYDGGTVTWVDGGMLRNFPINAFDRVTAARRAGRPSASSSPRCRPSSPPRRPPGPPTRRRGRCLHTMMNEWDAYGVDAATAGRTIFVDNAGISTTDFDLVPRSATSCSSTACGPPPPSSSRWGPGAGSAHRGRGPPALPGTPDPGRRLTVADERPGQPLRSARIRSRYVAGSKRNWLTGRAAPRGATRSSAARRRTAPA